LIISGMKWSPYNRIFVDQPKSPVLSR
jgi:hypothetical protein